MAGFTGNGDRGRPDPLALPDGRQAIGRAIGTTCQYVPRGPPAVPGREL